jgi:hypothetical protein
MARSFRSLLVLASGLCLIAGCSKDQQNPKEPSQVSENTTDIHPQDLVAFLDGRSKTLFVLGEEKDAVLKQLGAEGTSSGGYTLKMANIHRKFVPVEFTIRTASLPQLLQLNNLYQISAYDLQLEKDSANRDPNRATLIDSFTHDDIYYRTYKNAECGRVRQAFEAECHRPLIYYFSLGSHAKPNPPREADYTERVHFYEIAHCLHGRTYCTEALVVSETTQRWDNLDCTGAPVSVRETNYDFPASTESIDVDPI